MRSPVTAMLAFVLLAGQACQSPAPAPPAHVEEDPAMRANAALEGGRYAEAVGLFRETLARTPENVAQRYGLAVALSYVDRGAAIREFQWVMARAPGNSQEGVESQAWLARAGALPASPPPPRPDEPGRQAGNAVLLGRATFAEAAAKPQPMGRLQLFLVGQPDSPTKEGRYILRTDENGDFKFPNVPPGPYMLTNRLAGQPIWRLRVELKPAEEKQLDLNSGNSVTVRDDFPGR
jgi:hypothetical protein